MGAHSSGDESHRPGRGLQAEFRYGTTPTNAMESIPAGNPTPESAALQPAKA